MDCMCPTRFMKNYQTPVVIVGKVQEKKIEGKNIVKYKIADDSTTVLVVCVIYDFKSNDGMTFKETHEEIEIGSMVEIYGRPGMSRNSVPILYGATVVLCEVECDRHDRHMHERAQAFYTEVGKLMLKQNGCNVQDSSQGKTPKCKDSDSDYTSSDTEIEDEDSETDDSDDINEEFNIKYIPLTITDDYIIYQGKKFAIQDVIAGTPMQVSLGTDLGKFVITDQVPGKYIGVEIPANNLEPSFPNGYDIIIKADYADVLDILYRR